MAHNDSRTVRGPEPRYKQVKSHVLQLIASGKLPVHGRLPSEYDLVESLKVSRMTVNRALRELVDEEHIVRIAGVGTFVADPRAHSNVLRVRNIADEIGARGHTHTAKVIRLEEAIAKGSVANALESRPKERVFHSVIVHMENGEPLQLEDRYVSPKLAPAYLDVDFTQTTPNAYLTSVAPLHSAEHIVRATVPRKKVASLLKMGTNEPCLVITRRTWSNGRPVSYAQLTHPGSRFELICTIS